MAPETQVTIRPRTTGEIVDDAWRLYVADAPLLLVLSGLFNIPLGIALVFLICRPEPEQLTFQWALPLLTAFLLSLTGLGCGACQELFRRRAEGSPVTLVPCVLAAGRRFLTHVSGRALMMVMVALATLVPTAVSMRIWGASIAAQPVLGIVLGVLSLGLAGLVVWPGSGTLHAIVATREGSLFEALATAGRDMQRQPGTALAVTLCWLALFFFGFWNLHVLTQAGLWVAGDLAGFDVALWSFLLALANPPYTLTLLLVVWLLLAPYGEAAGYLLHVNSRARYEGLDLWYRVRRHFPTNVKGRPALVLLAVGLALLLADPARAAEDRTQTVREVRKAIQQMKAPDEFPGSKVCQARLRSLARRLDPAGSVKQGSFRWFYEAADDIGWQEREQALRTLAQLDRHLELVERELREASDPPQDDGTRPRLSRDQVKQLLPPSDEGEAHAPTQGQRPEVIPRDDEPDDEDRPTRNGRHGPGAVRSGPVGGLGPLGWLLLVVLLAVVAVTAVVLVWRNWTRAPRQRPDATGKTEPSLEDFVRQPQERTAAALWRQADQLAASGQPLQALRMLYLAVLTLLHRAHLIRYETTRTNGEYVLQLRQSAPDLARLHDRFRQMTHVFDVKWYGEHACDPADYRACRAWADEIREGTPS